jgi:hypothetical protein
MKLYATIKNNRGGKKSTGDNLVIKTELFFGNTLIGVIGLYTITDKGEAIGYRVIFDDLKGFKADGSSVIAEKYTKGKKQKGKTLTQSQKFLRDKNNGSM